MEDLIKKLSQVVSTKKITTIFGVLRLIFFVLFVLLTILYVGTMCEDYEGWLILAIAIPLCALNDLVLCIANTFITKILMACDKILEG